MLELGKSGLPRSKTYYVNEPGYDMDAAWLKKKLRTTAGYMYFSSGEADYQVYAQLEEDFKRAKDENNADIHFVAGPIISIPEYDGIREAQEGRENLSPIVRLAKEGKILLYPSDKRLPYTFRVFEDIPVTNVLEPYAPGENPSGSWYIYYSGIEAMTWVHRFREATDWKQPVSDSFLDHFLFVTDKEIAELKKWTSKKNIDINKIDLKASKEFWRDYMK